MSRRAGQKQPTAGPQEQDQAKRPALYWWPFPLVLGSSALAWGVLFLAIPPARQDFPLNDDWAFGRGALLFSAGQGIHYSNWASMPQLGQWLWACPFVWLLGPSFFALRVSTILLSWLGLWAFYDLLRQESWPAGRAALAAAVMAFHPLFFLLQGTFMTDVPALSFSLGTLAFYVRAVRRQQTKWLTGAVAVAILAGLTRQNTVAVPLLAAFLLARETALRSRPLWWLSVLVPALVGAMTHVWFQGRPDIIPVEPRVLPPPALLLLPFVVIHWCGLTALPLLVLPGRSGSRRTVVLAFVILVLSAGYWFCRGRQVRFGELFPYTGSILSAWGALLSSDIYLGQRPLLLGLFSAVFLTLLGCLGGALFVGRALTWDRSRALASPLLLFSLSQIIFILIAPALWDRYLLPVVVPGALVLAGTEAPSEAEAAAPGRRWAAVALLAFLGLTSVGLMHDWLAWNSTSWELGRRAVARGIDPLSIEGGMEWDGWHVAPYAEPQRRSWGDLFLPHVIIRKVGNLRKGLTLMTTRVWFPQITGGYALSFSPLPGAAQVDSKSFRAWLTFGEQHIYLLAVPKAEPRP